ncbi:hypothetical protein HFK74_23790|uniref:hypothetical protein n=1 Tax=Pseudomonas sp. SbOxS1 TaxID=2723884 RepID=UPI0015D27347|nr:hypothetical protein [Pseudomonas sp. SbOxS1]NYU05725.1 hypothetical protein [Pseudomonas sp. SbOxS1]
MRLTLETKAVGFAFASDDLKIAIDSSVLSMSECIYNEYAREADEDGSGFYREIIKKIMSSPDNYFFIQEDAYKKYLAIPLCDFLKSAYINGNNLVSATNTANLQATGNTYGIDVSEASTYKKLKKTHKSANIIDIIETANRTKKHPSIISCFFKGEVRVVIYDRYINRAAIELITKIAKCMSKDGELIIISEFNSGITEEQTSIELKKIIKKLKPTPQTSKSKATNMIAMSTLVIDSI